MLSEWVREVVSASELASELRAYLLILQRRFDASGQLIISSDAMLSEARRVGRHPRSAPGQWPGFFECRCGRPHEIRDASVACDCGVRYDVEWSGDGCRVVEAQIG